MGIEKITDRIAAEAKADYDAVVGSAKQEAESILADAKAAAEKILADAEESGRTEKEKAVTYGKSAADIDAGKIILKKKQDILSDCFAEMVDYIIGIEEYRYVELLVELGDAADMYGGKLLFNAEEKENIGQKVCDGLNRAVASKRRDRYGDEIQYADRFTLDDGVGNMKGGYIVTYRSTFADCTIESLVKEHRTDLAGEAAKVLFT